MPLRPSVTTTARAFMYRPEVLDPAFAFVAELPGAGPVLELAIGTGRVAIPLAQRGISVTGIELSQPMACSAGRHDARAPRHRLESHPIHRRQRKPCLGMAEAGLTGSRRRSLLTTPGSPHMLRPGRFTTPGVGVRAGVGTAAGSTVENVPASWSVVTPAPG